MRLIEFRIPALRLNDWSSLTEFLFEAFILLGKSIYTAAMPKGRLFELQNEQSLNRFVQCSFQWDEITRRGSSGAAVVLFTRPPYILGYTRTGYDAPVFE